MSEAETLEIEIEAAKKIVERAEALKRLRSNKDFKTVILDFYLVEYSADTVRAKADYSTQSEEKQRYIDNQLNAIGHLDVFMRALLQQGESAKDAIISYEEERDYIRNEEMNSYE